MAIVIIADDLSGAAELAGIAFARGLTAEVQRAFDSTSPAAVIAVDTNSRSLSVQAAAARVAETAQAVAASRPAWIFKKTDSVLRGNVRAEIEAILSVTGQDRAVLMPANPSRGRTIASGCYSIDGVPLHMTGFAGDPEHPRQSASLVELLRLRPPPHRMIATPDAASLDDLRRLAGQLDEATLAAGAADFFTALLDARTNDRPQPDISPGDFAMRFPALLVCGSRVAWQRRVADCEAAGVPICTSPLAASRLPKADRLLAGLGDADLGANRAELMSRLADLAAFIGLQSPVAMLLAEGGATAAAVADRMGWRRLSVVAMAPAGVGVLQPLAPPGAPTVLIKPGSYDWPAPIWNEWLQGGKDARAAQFG
jgi:uncharacterized protein YgbK (DUF1537 family)